MTAEVGVVIYVKDEAIQLENAGPFCLGLAHALADKDAQHIVLFDLVWDVAPAGVFTCKPKTQM